MSDPSLPVTFFRLQDTQRSPYTRREYLGRYTWRMVEKVFFRFPWPRRMRVQRWLLRKFGATQNGHVDRTVRVWHPWLLEVSSLTVLSERVTVYNLAPVRIKHQTVVSQDVFFCAGTHDYRDPTLPLVRDERAAISVGAGVWICAGAFIGPGVSIGDNSIVAARSVVVKDVPPNVIVGGNPAKVIGPRPMES